MSKPEMKPTEEQSVAIDLSTEGESMKIVAYAGAGKTTTLQQIGKALDHKKGIYLAFNKAIAVDAQRKFGSNITCKTFHGQAMGSCPRWLIDKLNNPRTFPQHVIARFNIQACTVPVKAEKRKNHRDTTRLLTQFVIGSIVISAVGRFCRSTDTYVKVRHVYDVMPDWVDPNHRDSRTLAAIISEFARQFWDDITNPEGTFKLEHDHYLKYWSINKPTIGSDFILFDEAQDADPIMLGALQQQSAQVIYVGDRHQQIYGWRGAVNAMQSLQIPEARLSQSFRFGPAIADVANIILRHALREKYPLRGFDAIPSRVAGLGPQADAYLCRKNSSALELLVELTKAGRKPKLEADIEALKASVQDVYNIMNDGPHAKLSRNSPFEGFQNWDQVNEFCTHNPKADIVPLVKLCTKNQPSQLLMSLSMSSKDDNFDCIISTAHKSKGLEFDNVFIYNDFMFNVNKNEPEKKPLSNSEARLLYVACTRAKKVLDCRSISELLGHLKDPTRPAFVADAKLDD